jgi:hypothetical protein
MRKLLLLLIAAGILLNSCSKKIDGTIVDNFGKTIENAKVEIENSDFSAITDKSGNFKLDYVAGKIKINIKKDGYVAAVREIELAQKDNYPLGKVELISIPDSAGVYFKDSLGYRNLFTVTLPSQRKSREFFYSKQYYTLYFPPDSLNIIETENNQISIYQFEIAGINVFKPNKHNVIALKEEIGITPQFIVDSEVEKLGEKFYKRTFNAEKGDVIVLVRGNSTTFLGKSFLTYMENSGIGISAQ